MELDDWQKEVLEYDGDFVLCTGRQVGKTTIMAIKAAEFMIKKPGSKGIIVSLTEDQAKLIIVMILDYLEKNYKKEIAKGKDKPTQNKIMLKNKSSVLARPVGNTGDAVRGFTGDFLIIDEASRMPELAFTAGLPVLLTTGGQIWMCSTPHGKQGYFYESFVNKAGQFRVWHISSEEVIDKRTINESWTEMKRAKAMKHLADRKQTMSQLEYGQEYMGLFLDDLQQFFPDELIRACMKARRPQTIDRTKTHYIGVDIARMGDDETTFEILKKVNDKKLIQVENQIFKKTLLTETAKRLLNMDELYDFRRIYVDDEGIGIGVFDILISEDRTKRKVEALRNSRKVIDYKEDRKKKLLKSDLYQNLLRLMEKGEIDLLEDDVIFQSFKSVMYEFTTDKKGQPFMRIFGNYTHIVEGLIRAAWCVKDKSLNIFIDYI